MNLRDATKIINKADTGITLNKSEQKLAELMLHAPSDKKLGHSFGERPTLSDILRNRASDFHPQNGSAMIDINAIDSSQTALCQKDIEDSDLHHVLKVSIVFFCFAELFKNCMNYLLYSKDSLTFW